MLAEVLLGSAATQIISPLRLLLEKYTHEIGTANDRMRA